MTPTELYVHIPFCMKKCAYCDFLSGPYDAQIRKRYTKALIRELVYHARRMDDCEIVTVYVGGGTPTWLETRLMERIMKTISRNFHVASDAEITIECNPKTATQKDMNLYRSMGFNRISIGLQSANPQELEVLGRVHDYETFVRTFDFARQAGFDNISVDLMTGIPGQTPGSLKNTIDKVTLLQPEHISCYALIIEEHTAFWEKYGADDQRRRQGLPTEYLPNEDQEYELYKFAQRYLSEKGYGQYEISNYAKMGHVCRHNIGYWKRVPYLGVGIGAASLLDEIRYTNPAEIYDYMERIEDNHFPIYAEAEAVSRAAAMEEFMFLGLRMTEGVQRREFEETFGISMDAVYGPVISELTGQGLLESAEGFVRLSDRGMDLGNYVMSCFLFDRDASS